MQRLLFPLVLVLALLLGAVALWLAREAWEEYEHGEAYLPHDMEGGTGWREKGLLSLREIIRRLDLPEKSRILEVEREEKEGLLYYEQASLRSRERFWDIRVPKIDSIFDNSLVPRPSWSPGVPPQHRKLVAATHRSPI